MVLLFLLREKQQVLRRWFSRTTTKLTQFPYACRSGHAALVSCFCGLGRDDVDDIFKKKNANKYSSVSGH